MQDIPHCHLGRKKLVLHGVQEPIDIFDQDRVFSALFFICQTPARLNGRTVRHEPG